jgi:hypothetical protein
LELLFKAFERHQYYYLKDLIKITQQPMVSSYVLIKYCEIRKPSFLTDTEHASHKTETTIYCMIFPILGTFKRNPQEHLYLQYEEPAQEHVGTKTRI